MANIAFSIIVPMYNVGPYIARCARSLFGQTLCTKERVEFLFVNDCTPDDSVSILEQVIQEYPQLHEDIHIINLPVNGGLFMARHHGILAARGEYIAHVDSDDYVDLTMFEKMLGTARVANADMVWCGMVHEKVNGECPALGFYHPGTPDEFLRNAVNNPHLWCVWGKIFRRRIAVEAEATLPQERINAEEDLLRLVPFLLRCKECAPLKEALYHYCENPDSISKSGRDYFPDTVRVDNLVFAMLPTDYKEEILEHKRQALWSAILRPTPSSKKLYRTLWPEAKHGILKAKGWKASYRFFWALANISYPLSVWLWQLAFPCYMRLTGKGELLER